MEFIALKTSIFKAKYPPNFMQTIARGAEAVITKNGNEIIKERIPKGYRIKEIDEKLRKHRTKTEISILREARRCGVKTPQIIDEQKFSIKMDFIDGIKVRDCLEKDITKISTKIGDGIAKLHDMNIIHGDLTTSNMLLKDEDVYFIDFGLSFHSERAEDKANDLYLLKEALDSTHIKISKKAWEIILNTYKSHYSNAESVINTFKKIEKRRRYKGD